MEPTHYVLGFMLSPDRTEVVLIRKNKPEWQAGRLNGVGGKVERGETAKEAMAREFMEETGVPTDIRAWHRMGQFFCTGATIHCFRAFGYPYLAFPEDEKPEWHDVDDVLRHHKKEDVMENVNWLLPIAASRAKNIVFYVDLDGATV